MLVGLFGLFGYAGLRTAQRARDRYGKLLAAGITSLILIQALINLFAVMGLAPLTGVPLPFVSYGNSSLLVTLAAVGLLLGIARNPAARAASPGARYRQARCDTARGRRQPPWPASPDRKDSERVPRVAIAAGGTAGHVVPALAVADALRDRGAEVSFLGAEGRSEAELVPAAGFEIDLLRVEGIDRSSPLRAARAVGLAVAAAPAARRLLRRRRPDAVMGGGGYVAGPPGLAAISLRLPLVLTEADRHLGLANRLLARRARRVCLAFPIEGLRGGALPRHGPAGPGGGRPRGPRRGPGAVRHRARRALPARLRRQPGRSQHQRHGARGVRRAADAPERDFHVLHIAGHRDYPAARERLDGSQPERYTLLEYEPNLADALAACDLVLARAGGSVFELAAAGRPAILVPYPYAAARHQHANADWMAARRGSAWSSRTTSSTRLASPA